MTTTDSSNPGEAFRNTREKLGLTIADVSVATKISPRILKALEDGDREGLPPHSFARGFIRSYASYLKIESQPILDAYKLTEPAPNPNINTDISAPLENKPQPTTEKRKAPNVNESTLTSKALLIGGLVLVILIVISVKSLIDKYAHERVLDPAYVEGHESAAPVSKVEDTKSEEPTLVEPKAADSVVAPAGGTTESAAVTAAPGAAATTPVAEAKPAEVVVEKTKEVDAPTPKEIETKPVAVKPAIPQEVILEALDAVDVVITIDGEDTKKIKLLPESVHTIKAKSSIELEIKDGGMVNIIHNGRDRGIPGDLGKPTKIKFP